MIQLSDEQLHNLGKEALIIIVSSLQDQLHSLQSQLDHANAQLSDTNRQIELLTEQIRIMNQRHFGRKSEANLSEIARLPRIQRTGQSRQRSHGRQRRFRGRRPLPADHRANGFFVQHRKRTLHSAGYYCYLLLYILISKCCGLI